MSRFHCTISLLLVTVVNLVKRLTLVLLYLNFFINAVVMFDILIYFSGRIVNSAVLTLKSSLKI